VLTRLAKERVDQLYLDEMVRARARVDELRERYPSASPQELARRLTDTKKAWASTGGAISGLFGLISLPADLAFVTVLQVSLIMEIALLFKTNLKSDRSRSEVLEVLGYSNGADTVNLAERTGTKLAARIAEKVLARRGLATLGKAVPIVAAPIVAYFNNRDLQRAGEAALRFYGTIRSLNSRKREQTG